MHEHVFKRIINLEEEGITDGIENAHRILSYFVQKAQEIFGGETGLTIKQVTSTDECVAFEVHGKNFEAEFKAEIARNVRYIANKEEKYLSLSVNARAQSLSLQKKERTGKELSFWFAGIGFVAGILLLGAGMKLMAKYTGYIVYSRSVYIGIVAAGGAAFGKIAYVLGNHLFYREMQSLSRDDSFQTLLDTWNTYISYVRTTLDAVFGSQDENKNVYRENKTVTPEFDMSLLRSLPVCSRKQRDDKNYLTLTFALTALQKEQEVELVLRIEYSALHKYLIMRYDAVNGLILSIPLTVYSEAERGRARRYFEEITKSSDGLSVFKARGGMPVNVRDGLDFILHDKTDTAVRMILDIFEKVYQLPASCDMEINPE